MADTTLDDFVADWPAISRQRADFYAWFCALFAAELDDAQLQAYCSGAAAPLLDACEQLGLPSAARLAQSIVALRMLPYARIELAADFAQLFLLDSRHTALPYASFYREPGQRLFGDEERRMRDFLRHGGLRLQADFREPADHLAVYLAVMERGARALGSASAAELSAEATAQAAFVRDALLTWLPDFVTRCQTITVRSDFYPACAALLLEFVRDDVDSLSALA